MRIGYLTSSYARASDSFVRGEVLALRELGHQVSTYSIRKPDRSEWTSEEIRGEAAGTAYLLAMGRAKLAGAFLCRAGRTPGQLLRAARLAARFGTPGVRGRLLPLAYLVEATLLADLLARDRVEHLHDHISEGSAVVALLAAELAGITYSFTVHGPEELERASTLGLDLKTARAAFVIAITEFARSQVLRWIPTGEWSKVHVVHCGVDPSFLADPPGPPRGMRLVTIGRMVEQKGQLVLIEALAAARRDGVEFELSVIGDGPLRGDLEAAVARLGLAEAVALRGWLPADAVRAEIDGARALVVPSFAEGLPIVLMEAMARRRPVVSTAVGGIDELVAPGVNGWLCAAGSVDDLRRALEALAHTDEAALARLGEQGAAAVRARHDRRAEARKLAALMARR
jgi:colanic acid/amylovoran biosynthesis glycosyltransferase